MLLTSNIYSTSSQRTIDEFQHYIAQRFREVYIRVWYLFIFVSGLQIAFSDLFGLSREVADMVYSRSFFNNLMIRLRFYLSFLSHINLSNCVAQMLIALL